MNDIKVRFMTNEELAQWLAKGNGQWKNVDSEPVYICYEYKCKDAKEPVPYWILIKAWDEEIWHEPKIEVAD